MQVADVSPFTVERLGVVMRPDLTREAEVEGVLNPGAARGPDGELYLFPRLVGKNNYSRIGIALEPEEPYELRPAQGTGGCEDARVTFVEPMLTS
jgi:beta-1,2-mannobiose phosphorylase / 1,2-beta-oligomannan phosphorylase